MDIQLFILFTAFSKSTDVGSMAVLLGMGGLLIHILQPSNIYIILVEVLLREGVKLCLNYVWTGYSNEKVTLNC